MRINVSADLGSSWVVIGHPTEEQFVRRIGVDTKPAVATARTFTPGTYEATATLTFNRAPWLPCEALRDRDPGQRGGGK